MREVALEIPAEALEDVLDRLLPILPGGVHEIECGERVELRMRGEEIPAAEKIVWAAGHWRHRIEERTVPDDWQERRVADYQPDLIGGRLIVRPDWAPPAGARGVVEIELGEGAAFGAGTHPTTRACLELLLGLEPSGAFADLGCGTGVLAIAAAKLGWSPVIAVDVQPASVEATRANAAANRVDVAAEAVDLAAGPAPRADGIAANVPAWLHERVAGSLPEPLPVVAVLSGFVRAEADRATEGYLARGFRLGRELDAHGWVVVVLERP